MLLYWIYLIIYVFLFTIDIPPHGLRESSSSISHDRIWNERKLSLHRVYISYLYLSVSWLNVMLHFLSSHSCLSLDFLHGNYVEKIKILLLRGIHSYENLPECIMLMFFLGHVGSSRLHGNTVLRKASICLYDYDIFIFHSKSSRAPSLTTDVPWMESDRVCIWKHWRSTFIRQQWGCSKTC